MAKSTRAQEASTGSSDSYTAAELNDPSPPFRIQRAMLGEVDRPRKEEPSLAGMGSSPSSESESTSSDKTKSNVPKPARSTENPSSAQEKETDSAARSTGTGGLKRRRPQSNKLGFADSELDEFDF